MACEGCTPVERSEASALAKARADARRYAISSQAPTVIVKSGNNFAFMVYGQNIGSTTIIEYVLPY